MSEDTAFDGVRVTIDTVARARGAVLLLHGFTRHPRHLDLLAGRFVDAGVMVVRPHLASLSPVASMNRPSVLARAARSIAEAIGDPRLPLVVVGHSAGAAAGSGIAAHLLDAGAFVRGLVLVDGVESPTRSIERAWPRIGQLPMFCVCAPPSRCNRQGALAEWLRSRRTGAFGVVVRGAGHGDIEGQE
ncbi:MAG: hypothetical protein F2793_00835, partial [Actinobacteria bacterium]|nr:hypothetical protein [Actinomycetota bacterium]